jgi:TolB-like protein
MSRKPSRPLVLAVACLLVASTNCATVRPYRVTNYFRSGKVGTDAVRRLAVLPFENLTGEAAAAGIVADEFGLQVGRTGLFELVERNRIDALWQEQDLDTLYRFDPASAVRVGRMLGAQAVVLGSVTKFRPHPDVKVETARREDEHHRHDHSPPTIVVDRDHRNDAWEVIIAALAVITVIGAVVLLLRPKPPAAEVGVSVRIVEVETGEVVWQAKDNFRGDQRSVQALADQQEDRQRMVYDLEYLTRVLCRELASTLAGAPAGTPAGQ